MPDALSGLSRAERITYCNDAWKTAHPRVAVLDFSRDRKLMSVLVGGGSPFTLFTKVPPVLKRRAALKKHMHIELHPPVAVLDFSRDRKSMSVLVFGVSPFTLLTKVLPDFE